MSDRCVFAPYLHVSGDYGWADVVIAEKATEREIIQAAEKFLQLPGPHRVFVANRNDQRFKIFALYLENHWGFSEERGDYSVLEHEQ